jgi:hypothetical protein
MPILGLVAFAAAWSQAKRPILWMYPATGEIYVKGEVSNARATPGARQVKLSNGFAFDFDGTHGGVLLEDLPALRLTGSFTVSSWLFLRAYCDTNPTAQSQVLFRGDDRCGADPYTLTVRHYGAVEVGVDNAVTAGGEVPLNRWVHVLGSYEAKTGELKMWIDGDLVGMAKTSRTTAHDLEPSWTPGIGIGNVQNEKGPHNQPFNGIIADLRLYDRVYSPLELGIVFGPFDTGDKLARQLRYTVN